MFAASEKHSWRFAFDFASGGRPLYPDADLPATTAETDIWYTDAMNNTEAAAIAAVIAAAGFSRRMGEFKQLLPWGTTTVIEAVVANLQRAGADPVLCVVGHRRNDVAAALAGTEAQLVYNADYDKIEMLRSYQIGVQALLAGVQANGREDPSSIQPIGVLLALGDQPHIPVEVIACIIGQARETPAKIVVPSHQMRRGHPIYLPRRLWPDLLALGPDQSLRDLLNGHEQEIQYIAVETDAIRRDMDYWVEYKQLRQTYERDETQGV
jgi:molybdenum cofactor cytidylyltransferase